MGRPSSNPRVVERESELDEMAGWLAEAAGGHGRVILITGEAGAGKSTLVREAARGAPGQAAWLTGACDSVFTRQPLAPFLDLAPALGMDPAVIPESDLAVHQLARAVLDVPAGSSRVVVIEDIHWADEATLDLLRVVARRAESARLALVVTCRTEPGDVGEATQLALGDLARLPAVRSVAARSLTLDGVRLLCAGTARDPAALHQLSGGNPFYVTELLGSAESTMPRSVRDAILARLVGLDPGARRAVEAMASCGMRSGAVGDHATLALTAESEEALRERAIIADDAGPARFRHEITREVIAAEIPNRRRAALHQAALEELLAAGTEDHAHLAFHAEGAGDRDATYRHAREAGARASRLGSNRDAIAHYRRALSAAADPRGADAGAVWDEIADGLGLLDLFEESLEARREATTIWESRGDRRRLAGSLRRGAWIRKAVGDPDGAVADCSRALGLLEDEEPGYELAAAHTTMARMSGLADQSPTALRHIEAAKPIAEKLALEPLLAELLNIEATVYGMLGEPWEPVMDRSQAIAAAAGNQPLVARAEYNRCCLLVLEARFAEADPCYERALAHAEEHDLDTYARGLRRVRGTMLMHLGRWDEALAATESDDAVSPESGKTLAEASAVRISIWARRGMPISADVLDDALCVAEEVRQPQHLVPVRIARAEAFWLRGDLEAAQKEVRHGIDLEVIQVHLHRDLQLWSHRLGLGGRSAGVTGPAAREIRGEFAAASREWERLGCPYDAALALMGSTEAEQLAEAVRRLDALGATAVAALARRRMRELGHTTIPVRPRASTRANPGGLTRREQEVLALVAEGLRNADIAERLFLSPRTVAAHLSNIMRKLGALSRGEAAAWAREQEQLESEE